MYAPDVNGLKLALSQQRGGKSPAAISSINPVLVGNEHSVSLIFIYLATTLA